MHTHTLYDKLIKLTAENEAFYYVDQLWQSKTFRVFTYRLASYSDFLLPGAIECRGHTFELNSDGSVLRLASLPMEKFFNAYENPLVMNLDFSQVELMMHKRDGSLISSVTVSDGTFTLKSKTSFDSEQAKAARELLFTNPEYSELLDFVQYAASNDYTVNMEYCAPDNRIVIGYDKPSLTVLNVRDNLTGQYVPYEILDISIRDFLVEKVEVEDPVEFCNKIKDMTGIEGYVLWFPDFKVKMKTDAYCILHKTKDAINTPRKLFEACLYETADDLRALFHSDELAIKQINDMEKLVVHHFNHISVTLENFYKENKHLDRKSYAILGQEVLKKDGTFSLAMNLYIGKDLGLKEWMLRNYKMFGIVDTTKEIDT